MFDVITTLRGIGPETVKFGSDRPRGQVIDNLGYSKPSLN